MIRAFCAGLLAPSAASLGGAAAVVVALFLCCVSLLDEDALASGLLVTMDGDEYAAMAGESVRLRRQGASGARRVVVLGSSAIREALTSPQELAGSVSRRTKGPVESHVFAAGGQFHLEALQIADWLPEDLRGVVVVEISTRNLGLTPDVMQWLVDHPRLPLYSPSFDAGIAEVGLRVRERPVGGVLALDYAEFFLARQQAVLNLFTGPIPIQFHQVQRVPPPTEAQWWDLAERQRGWYAAFATEGAKNLALYARLIRALQARTGVEVILVEAPRNPWMRNQEVAPDLRARYRDEVAKLGSELGVTVLNPAEDLDIPVGAFRDYAHLHEHGARRAFTDALVDEIVRLWEAS